MQFSFIDQNKLIKINNLLLQLNKFKYSKMIIVNRLNEKIIFISIKYLFQFK